MAIYLDYLFNIVNPFINTIFGLLALYYILKSESKVWFGVAFYRYILVLVDKFKLLKLWVLYGLLPIGYLS